MSWDGEISQKDPDAFDRLADHLERMRTAGLARVSRRHESTAVALAAAGSVGGWTGERAVAFTDDRTVIAGRVDPAEHDSRHGYDLLSELSTRARAVATAVREVRRVWEEEMSGFEHLKFDATDVVFGSSPVDHPAVHAGQEELRRWDDLCSRVAGELRGTIDRLNAPVLPGAALRRPGAGRDEIRQAWAARTDVYATSLRSDPARWHAWWDSLDDEERRALTEAERDHGRRDARDLVAAMRSGHGADDHQFDRAWAEDRDWAIGFYSELGSDGTRQLLDLLIALRHDDPVRANRLITGYATQLGRVIGAPELATIRRDLLTAPTPVEEARLDVILSGEVESFDPGFTARAAKALLGGRHAAYRSTAYRALAKNPEAARRFLLPDDQTVDRDALHALLHAQSEPGVMGRPSVPDCSTDAAAALKHVLFTQQDRPGSALVYVAAIEDIAKGGSTMESRRVAAESLSFYLDDLGYGARLQKERDDPPGSGAVASRYLSRKQLVWFFAASQS